jgi:hypothetical protein
MIDNCYKTAWECRGQTLRQWGKDATGIVEYQLNLQGFRHLCSYTWTTQWAFFGNSAVFGVGVDNAHIMTSYFKGSQNYGLSGSYMNHHSVTNLLNFVNTPCYNKNTNVVFFWIDREHEDIAKLISQVSSIVPGCLHISSGQKRQGAINLMPHIDLDVSGTHPGPRTHAMWAKTIKLLTDAKKSSSS